MAHDSKAWRCGLLGGELAAEDTGSPPALQDEEGLRLELIETAEHPSLRVPTRFYRMVNRDGTAVGAINLRLRSTQHVLLYGGHLGYTVYPQFRGEHYAARAVRLLLPVAYSLGIDPLWITTDPGNAASRRSCELAGASYVETVNVLYHQAIFPAGHPRKCRYRLDTRPRDQTDARTI